MTTILCAMSSTAGFVLAVGAGFGACIPSFATASLRVGGLVLKPMRSLRGLTQLVQIHLPLRRDAVGRVDEEQGLRGSSIPRAELQAGVLVVADETPVDD